MSDPNIATCPDCNVAGEFTGESDEGIHFRCPECEGEWIEEFLPVRHCSECGATMVVEKGVSGGYCEICRDFR